DAIAREATAGERVLVPPTIVALTVEQVRDRALRCRRVLALRGDQREQRPGGLRGSARAAATRLGVHVRFTALAEASVVVLARDEPVHRTAHRRAVHGLADR